MKIAILGTRGIPNNYGGFEQFAEYISVRLVRKGHEVTVYSPHFHSYSGDKYQGVTIRRIYSPESIIGAAANFVYDFLCLKDALRIGFDIILECGYHSNAPSYYLMNGRKSPVLITNMDGLEWMRSKWNKPTRWLIKQLEKLAVEKSHFLVSDNLGIQSYYQKTFHVDSVFIPYGAEPVEKIETDCLKTFSLDENEYYLLIARLEPENNIEVILDGFTESGLKNRPFVVVGNYNNQFGSYLRKKYDSSLVRFIGSIYDKNSLDCLRYFARIYFHGHSVGGTNPSLLEAMACQAFIAAHNNEFNRSVCSKDAVYFRTKEDVSSILCHYNNDRDDDMVCGMKKNNLQVITDKYSWEYITDCYEDLFNTVLEKK